MSKKVWRVIDTRVDCGAMQMAIDEAVLISRTKGLSPNTLRFFRWDPVCVSLGYFQSMEKEIDELNLKKFNYDIVRRYSGGGAVLHDNELTYSVILDESEVSLDVLESYDMICQAIILGLKELGVECEFKAINDILCLGKKISGNAQTRRDGVILQHGTILVDVDVSKMFSVLRVPDEKIKDKMIKHVRERVTCVNDVLGYEVELSKLRDVIISGFEKYFDVEFEFGNLNEFEIELADKLYLEKYSTQSWTNKR
jgi:lipoate---protein ligase